MNKQGNFTVIVVMFLLMFVLMFLAIIFAIGSATLNYVMDEVTPELNALGQIGDVNASKISEQTVGTTNTIVQGLTWLGGFMYILGTLGIFALAFAYRYTGERWLLPFYFLLVILLIVGSIMMSNIYEDFSDDDDVIASRLREQTLLNTMIIYSPLIFATLSFVAGIVLFTGNNPEGLQ